LRDEGVRAVLVRTRRLTKLSNLGLDGNAIASRLAALKKEAKDVVGYVVGGCGGGRCDARGLDVDDVEAAALAGALGGGVALTAMDLAGAAFCVFYFS
jgi:hypothetical protein